MARTTKQDEYFNRLMLHYRYWTQDMDTRRTRKNGWNDIVNAYMGKLPANWPFLSMVVDPRIRTSVLEKTSRLLNAKLQGRLIPRENGDVTKARINNAVLDFQWDYANEGGSMIEKVANADQIARLFGAAFALIYWNNARNTNEIKIIDPRDIGFDGAATHIRNARWVQVREYTTWDKLAERGFQVGKLKRQAEEGIVSPNRQDVNYESVVKGNRGLQNRVGEIDDPKNPIVEVVTEYKPDSVCIYLPRYAEVLYEGKNPYKHGKIPLAMLRYYPLGDDIYGEPEIESVLPLQRAINAVLCGFIDEMSLSMRPPLKISSQGVRIETIEYGPGAQWIMQNPNLVQEMQLGGQVIANFNAIYPSLVAAFNTAIGDSSLGISNVRGEFNQKTATEVKQLEGQQNNRDQYNQLYLGEFLKDIMMMWLANNKQYLFDDPSKKYFTLKIIGQDNIQALQAMKLDDMEIPDYAMQEISKTVMSNPQAVTDDMLNDVMEDVAVPKNPVITNPEAENPSDYIVKKKLDVKQNGQEAELYITPDDFEGDFDYIPDVSSMAAGAGQMLKDARQNALTLALNPQVTQQLMQQGEEIKIKELLIQAFEDGGIKDAEGLFQTIQNGQPNMGGQTIPPGLNGTQASQINNQSGGVGGVPAVPQAVPNQPQFPGISAA